MRLRLLGILVLGALLAAACGPAAPTTVPTVAGEAIPAGERPTDLPPTSPPTEMAALVPSPTAEMLEGADALQGALAAGEHAAAPAGPEEYRFDSGELVGATDSPQLVEFFTTW
ncbi:MAG: hypothetical protein JXN59_18255 [Anaerolineae bacterium]|nr:hypothetical protein [Anaerolineae bacterium]